MQYNAIQYNTTQYNEGKYIVYHGIKHLACSLKWNSGCSQKNIYSGWGCVFLSIEPFGSAESWLVGRQAAGWKNIFPNFWKSTWLTSAWNDTMKMKIEQMKNKHLVNDNQKWHKYTLTHSSQVKVVKTTMWDRTIIQIQQRKMWWQNKSSVAPTVTVGRISCGSKSKIKSRWSRGPEGGPGSFDTSFVLILIHPNSMFSREICYFDAHAGTLPKISWSTFVWLHREQGSCSPNDWSAQHARQRWAYSNLRAKLLCQWPSLPGPQRLFSWVCQWGWEDMGRHSRLFDTGAIDVSNQPTAL